MFRILLAAGLPAILSACDSDKAQPVSAQDFYARRNPAGSPISPLDRPGILRLPDSHAQPSTPAPPPGSGEPGPLFNEHDVPPLSTSIPSTLPAAALAGPATNPATQPSLATDEYTTLGGVVMVVNGHPIYADKVLRLSAPALRKHAKEMNFNQFEIAARVEIERTINNLRNDELAAAAAEQSLDPKDIQLARSLTRLWSQQQVAEAGGAEQAARLRAQESGEDFQDQEQDQYHRFLYDLYLFRKIYPQIDITGEDERRYYNAHLDDFTTPTQATIILIEANPDKLSGDPAAAKAKLLNIRKRVLAGEDFAAYGRDQNDLPSSTGAEGNAGQMVVKPNTLLLTQVEAQVWKTPPGQISDLIEDHDAFFIFKVLSRDYGGTKSFADMAVQNAIRRRLTDLKIQQSRIEEERKLEMAGIVQPPDPRMIDTAVEMALQNYPQWSKK
ncbi:MAG: peptidylprolyl isomerase [Tepidisphaeraceae bacterium]|jgi:parvulin-like peptidyl-prolyl isomerase